VEEEKFKELNATTNVMEYANDGLYDWREAKKARAKILATLDENKPVLFAFLISRLSPSSFILVKVEPSPEHDAHGEPIVEHHPDGFLAANDLKCPLRLWRIIMKTHSTVGVTSIGIMRAAEARTAYQQLQQGYSEHLATFHDREAFVYGGMISCGGAELDAHTRVMDYLRALDNAKFGEFKTMIVNGLVTQTMATPDSVNDLFALATNFVPSGSKFIQPANQAHASVFAVNGVVKGGGDKKDKKDMKQVKCFKCDKLGHYARDCKTVLAIYGRMASCFLTLAFDKRNMVLLDAQSDISVISSHLVTNIRATNDWVYINGISSGADEVVCKKVGDFLGVCEVYVHDKLSANVLCQADLEDMYQITYDQGVSYTVHTNVGDLVFARIGKHYACNVSDFVKVICPHSNMDFFEPSHKEVNASVHLEEIAYA
jgi:hypothetical protein